MKSFQTCKFLILATIVLAMSACGGGGSSDGDSPSTESNNSVDQTLNALGVSTEQTPRVDDQAKPLPDTYSPLGAARALVKIDELFAVGVKPTGYSNAVSLTKYYNGEATPDSTGDLALPGDHAWETESLRVATSGDIDGDGFEEMVVVYHNDTDGLTYLKIYDDESEAFSEYVWPFDNKTVSNLAVATGDFDGDATADIVVGLVQSGSVQLKFLIGSKDDVYQINESKTITLPTVDPASSELSLTIESGNIDHDAAHELAVVVNEVIHTFNKSYASGNASYFIFDDGATNFAELGSDLIQGRDVQLYTAVAGDVALGDIDGDNIDEIILAGITTLKTGGGCNELPDYLMIVLDDAAHDTAEVSVKNTNSNLRCESYNSWEMRRIEVNALDIDGDLVDELQVNQMVFEDFQPDTTPWTLLAAIDDTEFLNGPASNTAGGEFTPTSSALAVGDIDGDKREEIMLSPRGRDISIWGMNDAQVFSKKHSIDVASSTGIPLLIPVNVDKDSFVVEYIERSHTVVFTQPVIIAALAAAPCTKGIGQNVSACETTFGKSQSNTASAEAAVTISASHHTGVKGEFKAPIVGVGVEAEAEATSTVALTAAIHGSYTVTKSNVFKAGPLEDAVVYVSLPMDQYSYRIVSHANPDAVGKEIVYSIPREPIMRKTERQFYNRHVEDNGPQIDSSVFTHTVGNINSYPGVTQKNALLSEYGGLFSGYDNGPIGVGQGNASTSLGIDLTNEVGASVTLAVSYEFTAKLTAGGYMEGFSVGAEASSTLGYSVSNTTSFTGTVGDIEPGANSDDYQFGLFVYTMDDHASGQEFQVVNYWVE